jgi:signal transduction histidine kinase
MARVLIIDRDEATRGELKASLEDEHEVQTAGDTRRGLLLLNAQPWDVLILDPGVPDHGQLSVAPYVQELPRRPEVIVAATREEMTRAVATLRTGAFEFLSKPIDRDELHKAVVNAAQLRNFKDEKRRLDKRNREQRAQLEALVQERTQQMEQIFARVPGMLYRIVVNPDGFRLFSFVSSSCMALLETSHERIAEDADVFDSLIHSEDSVRFDQTRALAERTRTRFRFEGRFRLPSGRVRWMQCVANPTPLPEDCVAWDGILVDVTERVELQSRLLLSDRLATVGTMAASVAHEVNNPLSYINANLDSLTEHLRQEPGGDKALPMLREVLGGITRIENAMRDLQTFARSPEETIRPVNVNKVLDASVRLASNEIRHRAQLIKDYQEGAIVRADESSMGQLFLNLLVVAAQSIPEGNAHSNQLVVCSWIQYGEVNVEITDTSPGLPPEVLERAFDPFSAASERLRAGMGLYVCHRIVSMLGGQITATSSPISGNHFHVRLPAAQVDGAEPRRPKLRLVPSRPARVLIIDDEELVLKALLRVLEGHDVDCARSGREAVKMLSANEPYDLVLCDVMMPDMNGEDVYTAARDIRPGTQERFVFITGGAFTQDAHTFLCNVPNRAIEKPFTKAGIRQLITDLRI